MNERRQELKVGIFVCIGLVLIGALMIYFSKGQSIFKSTYNVYMQTSNVGGLKSQAQVLLSGVQIGTVESISLSADGKTATVTLTMLERYVIRNDAEFTIDSLGFLGDQYVGVKPLTDTAERLKEGDTVVAKAPFDFQELARASLGFVNRLDATAKRLNEAIARIDQMVLNEATLTNIAISMSNFVTLSERGIETVENLTLLFKTNAPPLNATMTNLSKFSGQLNDLAQELNETIVTNRTTLGRAMKNVEQISEAGKEVMADLQAGRGIAGGLLHDEQLKLELESILTNLNVTMSNLNILSSNINSKGLWRVLWKPKPEKR